MTEPATHFRDTVRAFLECTGTAPVRLGADVLGDPSFVMRLHRGFSPRLDIVERVRAWMAAHSAGSAGDISNGKGGDGSVKDTPIEYLSTRKAAAFWACRRARWTATG